MKIRTKLTNHYYPLKKALAFATSLVFTGVICSSTSVYASDIEIYQQARSGNISLMFVLDISGSMDFYDVSGTEYESCSGSNSAGGTAGSQTFNENGITYTRSYCEKSSTNYKYKRATLTAGSAAIPYQPAVPGHYITERYRECFIICGSWKERQVWIPPVPEVQAVPAVPPSYAWYSCGAEGSPNQSDCVTLLTNAPSLTGLTETGNDTANPKYYYKNENTKYYKRITLVKDAMYQLLYGANAIGKDKFLGLTTYSINGDGTRAQVRVPVKRLGLDDDETIADEAHRKTLMQEIAGLSVNGGTPTANAYAEAAAYMLGTSTTGGVTRYAKYNNNWYKCIESSFDGTTCTRNDNYTTSDSTTYKFNEHSCTFTGRNNNTSFGGAATCYYVAKNSASGQYMAPNTVLSSNKLNYQMPISLSEQLDPNSETKKCSGQGIYVLTDGVPNGNSSAESLMKSALSSSAEYSCSGTNNTGNSNIPSTGSTVGGWPCVEAFNNRLLNQTTNANPAGLTLKTAVVGFGNAFNSIPSYNRNLTEAQNVTLLGTQATVDGNHQRRAARWGIQGQGGWYAGTSSQDVINSVNEFINNLSTEIPAVTTGTSTIPIDQLNTVALQNYAYYPQFQPTPDKSYQLWAGNLKKYAVTETGRLVDKTGVGFVNAQGKIGDNYDYWSAEAVTGVNQNDESILGSEKNRLIGGLKSKLKLKHVGTELQRKLVTDRASDGTNLSASTLRTLGLDLVTSSDPTRGYLLSLLGYRVNPINPDAITADTLNDADELRQVGAVMHSSPILLTNAGKITYENGVIGSKERKDYVLFGTTQGLLHVVDAVTGEEKFAFVPNSIIESQKEAFMNHDSTIGGMDRLYYGVDAPWTSYTEYVSETEIFINEDDEDNPLEESLLTVGTNAHGKSGKQLVYGGLRMGGRNYYALDLANIDEPKLKFTITPGATNQCSSANPLACMGQSWSKPTITWVSWKGQKKLVMLVGGGYDAEGLPTSISDMPEGTETQRAAKQAKIKNYRGYEYNDYEQTNKIGAGVYMFDALDGSLLWWASANATNDSTTPTYAPESEPASSYDANMKYSVVSQIKAVDRNADGLSDHLYFGDLGGQVWRIDLNNGSDTETTHFAKQPTRILNLHNGANSPRFYESPAFSTYLRPNGRIFGVLSIGSGNRSQPLAEYVTSSAYKNDAVYNIYDKDVARNDLYNLDEDGNDYKFNLEGLNTKDITLLGEDEEIEEKVNKLVALNDDLRFTDTELSAPYTTTEGWYYQFKSNLNQSEKVMSTPVVIDNDMYVTTFDASKAGMSGDCGAGVKGESFMTLFCMPYGQCKSGTAENYRLSLGAGIVGGAVGAGDGSGMQRLIVANVDTSGITNNIILQKRYKIQNKFNLQRWYDRRQ